MRPLTIPRLLSGLALTVLAWVGVSKLLVVLLLVRAMLNVLRLFEQAV